MQHHKKPRLSEFDAFNYFHDSIPWNDLNEALENYNWDMEFKNKSSSDMLNRFYEICLSKSQEHVPQRTIHNNKKTQLHSAEET